NGSGFSCSGPEAQPPSIARSPAIISTRHICGLSLPRAPGLATAGTITELSTTFPGGRCVYARRLISCQDRPRRNRRELLWQRQHLVVIFPPAPRLKPSPLLPERPTLPERFGSVPLSGRERNPCAKCSGDARPVPCSSQSVRW